MTSFFLQIIDPLSFASCKLGQYESTWNAYIARLYWWVFHSYSLFPLSLCFCLVALSWLWITNARSLSCILAFCQLRKTAHAFCCYCWDSDSLLLPQWSLVLCSEKIWWRGGLLISNVNCRWAVGFEMSRQIREAVNINARDFLNNN